MANIDEYVADVYWSSKYIAVGKREVVQILKEPRDKQLMVGKRV